MNNIEKAQEISAKVLFKQWLISSGKSEKSTANYMIVFRQAKLRGIALTYANQDAIARVASEYLATPEGKAQDIKGKNMYSCALKLFIQWNAKVTDGWGKHSEGQRTANKMAEVLYIDSIRERNNKRNALIKESA